MKRYCKVFPIVLHNSNLISNSMCLKASNYSEHVCAIKQYTCYFGLLHFYGLLCILGQYYGNDV